MFRKADGEVRDPEESYEYIRDMVEQSEMPEWVLEELDKLWNNPDKFESGETLNQARLDNPLYLMFRLGVGFGTEYERKYPTDGDWRDES